MKQLIILIFMLFEIFQLDAQCTKYNIYGSSKLCLGSITTYNLNGVPIGLGLISNNSNVLKVGNSVFNAGAVTALNPGTATLSYVYRMNCGLLDTASLLVTVGNFPPHLDTIQNHQPSIAVGSSIVLYTGYHEGTWYCTPSNVAAVTSTLNYGLGTQATITGLAVGTVTVSYSATNACGTSIVSTNLNVTCSPDTITSSVSSCDSYYWDKGNDYYDYSGTYFAISVDSITGCRHVYKLILHEDYPVLSFSNTRPLCGIHDSVLIEAPKGGTWTSSDQSVLSVTYKSSSQFYEVAVIKSNGLGTATITYTINGACGLVHQDRTFVVENFPIKGIINAPSAICTSSTFTLSYSGSQGGTWSTSTPAIINVNPNTGLLTVISPGLAKIKYAFSNQCGAIADSTFFYTANGSGGVITGNATICGGTSNTYSSNGAPGGVWVSSNPAIARFISTGELFGVSTGSVTISYTILGCSPLTKRVTVDTIKPIIKCPTPITTNLGRSGCTTPVTIPNPVFSDNCFVNSLKYSVTLNNRTFNSPSTGINLIGTQTFSVGTYSITYTAVDAAGLSASCKFSVAVKGNLNCSGITSEPALETRSEPNFYVSIAPNPFRNDIKIELMSKNDEPILISVYNITGQRISMLKGNGSSIYTLGREWSSGIYIAHIQQGNHIERLRLIKQE